MAYEPPQSWVFGAHSGLEPSTGYADAALYGRLPYCFSPCVPLVLEQNITWLFGIGWSL